MKRILTFVFTAMLAGQAFAQQTTTFTVDGLTYTVIGHTNNVVVSQGSTTLTGAIRIPLKVNRYYTVTSIGSAAFSGCSSLTSVIIPNSITNISSGAFDGCNATLYSEYKETEKPSGWESNWNSNRPIKWGCNVIKIDALYSMASIVHIDGTNYVYKVDNEECKEVWFSPETENGTVTLSAKTGVGYHIAWEDNKCLNPWTFTVKSSHTYRVACAMSCARETDYGVEPTCTTDGKTYGVHCNFCKAVLVESTIIPALGHDYGEPTYSWSEDGSTCTATSVCKRDANHKEFENATITNAVTIAATCENKGTTTYTAKFTNNRFSTQTKAVVDVPALGHNYGTPKYEWGEGNTKCTATKVCVNNNKHIVTETAYATSAVTVAATCEETGTKTFTAEFADESFATQYTTESIAATGHTAAEAVAENYAAPTCTIVGAVDSVVYCTGCQNELNRKTIELPATGHTAAEAVAENYTAPTCTVAGSVDSVVYCSVCHDELTSKTIELAATGHKEVVDAAVVATCTGVGKTEGKHCSACEVVLVAQEEIAALGHTEVLDAAIAATCTTVGKTEGKHCSVCNETIVAQTEIPALGHEFKSYVYNNDATTAADGTETAKCERGCGTTDTRVAEGTKLAETTEKGTAVAESAANALNIYAYGKNIVVENATEEISVYDAMGKMICKEAIHNVRMEINVNAPGVYIVKTGNTVKRVMVN